MKRKFAYTVHTPGTRDWQDTKTPYTCPELGRTCHRPGAYDAFDLPSLYADVRKPYRFSKEMRDLETAQ
jgi:hypothetical protein